MLKRLFAERGVDRIDSGRREIFFGKRLRNIPHVAQFIESFEEIHDENRELFLVFEDAG